MLLVAFLFLIAMASNRSKHVESRKTFRSSTEVLPLGGAHPVIPSSETMSELEEVKLFVTTSKALVTTSEALVTITKWTQNGL